MDLRDWATARLAKLFKGKKLLDNAEMEVEIHKTELYGEAFATSRKGHTEATCNLDCRIYWRGKLKFNGGVVGTAHGTFKFPEVTASATPEDWPMKILADGEDPSAMRMLNPCGSMEETQLRPLEAYELKLRESVETKEDEIRGLMAKLIQDMRAHAAGEPVAEVTDDKESSHGSEVSESVRKEVEDKMEAMRIEAMPSKFKETLDMAKAGEAPEKIELSVSRMTDKELAELVTALKGDTNVKSLNLSFNQITDVGIQSLVTALATGACKSLEVITINNNQFGDMGKRMLGGVKMMRKTLKVNDESHI